MPTVKQDELHAKPNVRILKKKRAEPRMRRVASDVDSVKRGRMSQDKIKMHAGPNVVLLDSAVRRKDELKKSSKQRRNCSEYKKPRRPSEQSVGACVENKRRQLRRSKKNKKPVELLNAIVDDLDRSMYPTTSMNVAVVVKRDGLLELLKEELRVIIEGHDMKSHNSQLGHISERHPGLRNMWMHHPHQRSLKLAMSTEDKLRTMRWHDVKLDELNIDPSIPTRRLTRPRKGESDEQDGRNESEVVVTGTDDQKVVMSDTMPAGRRTLRKMQQLLARAGGRRSKDEGTNIA